MSTDTATIDPSVNGEPFDPTVGLPDAPPPEPAQAPPPPSEAELNLAEIIQMTRRVANLHNASLLASESAKAAKKSWEAASEQLQERILDLDRQYPLFDQPKPAPVEPEAWREIAIDILETHGLSHAIVEKLDEAGFHTIGHLADWTKADNLLTAIEGIGAKKAEKIEESLTSFWASQAPAADAVVDEHLEEIESAADAESNGQAEAPQ